MIRPKQFFYNNLLGGGALFPKGTVFVVGAGASCEFGFPVGVDLAKKIPRLIDFRWSAGRMVGTGSDHVLNAFRMLAGNDGNTLNELTRACKRIRDGLPLALSIDNFVHQHSSDAYIASASKIAIVKSILDAEHESKLFIDRRNDIDSIDFVDIADTWFVQFMRYLNAGVTNKKDSLSRISFIIFNYDRAIEHLIYNAIRKAWSLNDAEAAELAKTVNIIHPYGTVGPLPWEDSQNGIEFGDNDRRDIDKLSRRILTFTEQINDEKIRHSIRTTLDMAQSIIFLGFAYYKQNMEILKTTTEKTKYAFGTVYGMSESDSRHVQKTISYYLNTMPPFITLEKLTCSDFFSQYGRSLADI